MNLNEKVSIKFILIFFIGLVLGLLGSGFLNLSEGTLLYEGIQLQDNTEKWMTFMSILSTLFAVFFVYSGFAINQNLEKVEEQTRKFEREKKNYENSFQVEKLIISANIKAIKNQFEDGLDILDDILRKEYVEQDDNFKYRTYYESANINELYALNYIEQKEKSQNIETEVIGAIYYNAIDSLEKARKIYHTEDSKIYLERLKNSYNTYGGSTI